MTLQQILQQLKKSNPQLTKKYDDKHLLSVIEEQLFLRDYKNTFKEDLEENSITDNEEEEIELKPEEIPIEEPTEEVPTEEPELEEPEIQDEPQTEEEPEIEQEPEIQKKNDEEGEIEIDPETLPTSKQEPEKNIQKTKPEDKLSLKQPEGDGYIRISPTEARELLSYKGKIFTAIFNKRSDGSLRSLNGMTGVRKYTSGGELPYSPKEKELIPVYDLKKGPGKQGYRTIPIEGLRALKINGKKYKIDQTLNEIKVNNPNKVNINIIKDLENSIIDNGMINKLANIQSRFNRDGEPWNKWWDKINNINKINYYKTLKKLEQNNIQEIKVNNPNKTWGDILNLSSKLSKEFGSIRVSNKQRQIAKELGWEENGQAITTYFKNNSKLIPQFYNKLKQLEQNIQENMKKTALKNLIKEVLLEVKASKKILKEENEGDKKRRKTNFNYKSVFEDIVIKTNTAKKDEFPSLKQEWLDRVENSQINPITKKSMIDSINKCKSLSNLQEFGSYGLLKYEKMGLKENQPAPQRQAPDREVIEKPETDTPERKPRRRTLTPPTEAPNTRPKAIKENDKQIANKIADRFKKLK
jgi:hypothetical protein